MFLKAYNLLLLFMQKKKFFVSGAVHTDPFFSACVDKVGYTKKCAPEKLPIYVLHKIYKSS